MSGMTEIVPIEHETLGQRVYLQLREMLICGAFAPGDPLTLRKLAVAIGTSQMPVRDALRQLMVDQAIELLPKRIFRVPLMSRKRFLDLRDIRIEVEGMAVARAAQRITKSELKIAIARSATFNAECAMAEPNPAKLIMANKELHFTIYKAAKTPALTQIIEGLWTQIGPVLNLDVRRGSERITHRVPCEHHERLIQAMKDGDPIAAREALAADLNSAAAYIIAQDVLLA